MSLFDTGVIPAINQHLLDEAAKVRDYGDYWSASSAGYCMRKNIFERMKVPYVNEDARKQRVFSSGHIFHEWLQRVTKEAGLSIAQEVGLQDEDLMVRGHFDDLVLVPGSIKTIPGHEDYSDSTNETLLLKDPHLILYDYKTAHSKWFEYVKNRPMSYYNKMQLGTYMYMLRTRFAKPLVTNDVKGVKDILLLHNNELTEARILKISKDDLRLHEQQLLWSPALEKEIVSYWSTLNGYWKSKKLPKCTCKDYENGFMANPKYNPYFYKGNPCSIDWYNEWKANNKEEK